MHNYQLTLYAVPMILTAGLALTLAILQFMREGGSRPSRFMLSTAGLAALWYGAFALMLCSPNAEIAEVWGRIGIIGLILLMPALYHFCVVMLDLRAKRAKHISVFWTAFGSMAVLTLLSNWVVSGVYQYEWGFYPRLGPLASVYMAATAVLLYQLILEYRSVLKRVPGRAQQRNRLRLFLMALLITLPAAQSWIPALGFDFYPLDWLFVAAHFSLLATLGYRYGMLDTNPAFTATHIIDTMTDALVVLDNDGLIRVANCATGRLTGNEPDELTWKPVSRLSSDLSLSHVEDVASGREDVAHSELVMHSAAQGEVTLSLSASPIHDLAERQTGYVCVLRDVTARKRVEERAQHDALHDALTGLPNRTFFTSRIDRMLLRSRQEPGYCFALLFCDLDRFKVINDSLGHLVGDELLIAFAKRLTGCVKNEDMVARLGGDEFALLIDDCANQDAVGRVADRIMAALEPSVQIDDHNLVISSSIGIALSSAHYGDATELVRDADTAMYRAKHNGRGNYQIFDPSMHEAVMQKLRLEGELRNAIVNGEFDLLYQPFWSLNENRLTGFEALVRWNHPTRGLLTPADFLDVAEETGLIVKIGRWVRAHACAQIREWQERGGDWAKLYISVNVSDREFSQPGFVSQLESECKAAKVPQSSIKLELTERILAHDLKAQSESLARLRALNVNVMLDDFGIGYSSLSRLHKLPISMMKIDGSFIRDMSQQMEDIEIVRTAVLLAHNLKMEIVAEGVEEAFQVAALRDMGCDHIQGYYVGRPMPAAEATDLVTADVPEGLALRIGHDKNDAKQVA